jgi:hypothetical protein
MATAGYAAVLLVHTLLSRIAVKNSQKKQNALSREQTTLSTRTRVREYTFAFETATLAY